VSGLRFLFIRFLLIDFSRLQAGNFLLYFGI
jgi:hypothetical protein